MARIIPIRAAPAQPAGPSAGLRKLYLEIYHRLTPVIGWLFVKLNVPGLIRNYEGHDQLTGQHLRSTLSRAFVILNVDGRDCYFDRFTGHFGGTGMSMPCCTQPRVDSSPCSGQ